MMTDTLLAAMTFSGLMDSDVGDFFPIVNQGEEVVIDTTAPAVSLPVDNNIKEDERQERFGQGYQNGHPVFYPGSVKVRTIKLRNPDLASPKLTERNVNLAKKSPESKLNTNTQLFLDHPPLKRERDTEECEINEEPAKKIHLNSNNGVNLLKQEENKVNLLHSNLLSSQPKHANQTIFGMVPGQVQNLMNGTSKDETFTVQILSVKNRRVKISDGQYLTDKCFIAPEMKDIKFLDNPVIRVLEWTLVNLNLSTTKTETVIKINKFGVVENSKDFPVLGDPKTQSTEVWTSIMCFLLHLNLNPVHENVDLLTEWWGRAIGSKLVASKGYWQCAECEYYKSRQQRHIVTHIQMTHLPNFPGYKCPECSTHFQSTSEFERHMKVDHSILDKQQSPTSSPTNTPATSLIAQPQLSPNSGAYRCPVLQCQLRLGTREDFDLHIKSIHNLSLKFKDDVHKMLSNNSVMQPISRATDPPMLYQTQTNLETHVPSQTRNQNFTNLGTPNHFQNQDRKHDIKNLAANILGSMDSHFLTTEEVNKNVAHNAIKIEDVVTLEEDTTKHVNQMSNAKVHRQVVDDFTNWEEEVDSRIMRAGVLLHCTECDFKKMKEDLMVDHVQGKHLSSFPGYECPRCHEKFQTLVPFLVHMKMTHKSRLTEVDRTQCLFRPKTSPIPKFNVNPSGQDWLQTNSTSLNQFIYTNKL